LGSFIVFHVFASAFVEHGVFFSGNYPPPQLSPLTQMR
jgi:hypothetical protein